MMTLDAEDLSSAVGCSIETAGQWVGPLNEAMDAFAIWTRERQAGFLGQIAHESNGLRRLEEDLNYTATRLRTVWPNRFPTDEIAMLYAHNPQKLGSYVYANRFGNGDEASGDGYRFRGRGPPAWRCCTTSGWSSTRTTWHGIA
jgi:putative chitinase